MKSLFVCFFFWNEKRDVLFSAVAQYSHTACTRCLVLEIRRTCRSCHAQECVEKKRSGGILFVLMKLSFAWNRIG